MSWTCPHCDQELDQEILKYGVVLGKTDIDDYVCSDVDCLSCNKPIRIQFIAHVSYKPYVVEKRAQLTLVRN